MALVSIIVIVLVALLGPQVYKMIIRPALYEKPIFHHAPGPCELVKGVTNGAEDMEMLPSGLVIMSTGLRAFIDDTLPAFTNVKGAMKVFDFNHPEKGATDLKMEDFDMTNFNPHGLSIWQESGRVIVFVVNHHSTTDPDESIEKFEFDESKLVLRHIKSIRDPAFTLVNDIEATGADSFFYTNTFWNNKPMFTMLEIFSGVKLGNVGHYDGQKAEKLASGLGAANGLQLSPDGKYLYVGTLFGESLLVYRRESDNSLTLLKEYAMDCCVDNLDVQGNNIWIGCHPDFSKTSSHAEDPQKNPAPSKVLRLQMQDGEMTKATEVFSDDGRVFSASSVAVHYKDMLLLGSVDSTAMLCHIKYLGS